MPEDIPKPPCLSRVSGRNGGQFSRGLAIDSVLIGDETIIQREQYVHLEGATLVHTEEHTQTVWVNTNPYPIP